MIASFTDIRDWLVNTDQKAQDKVHLKVVNACWNLLTTFQTALKIYNKFDNLWADIQISSLTLGSDYLMKLKKASWLLFIYSKHSLLDGQELNNPISMPD